MAQAEYAIVTATYPDSQTAKQAAMQLVDMRLAACVQLFPINSVYLWQGEICDENETVLVIKSRASLFDAVRAAIEANHPYEVPEIVQIPIADGLPAYLRWISDCTEGAVP